MTKEQARHQLNYALRVGKLTKPDACAGGNPRVEGPNHSARARKA